MAVVVTDVAPVLAMADAVDLARLRGQVGLPHVAARVDNRDLELRCRAENGVGHLVDARGRVLPLVWDADPVHVSNGRLGRLRLRADVAGNRTGADGAARNLDRVERGKVSLDLQPCPREQGLQGLRGAVGEHPCRGPGRGRGRARRGEAEQQPGHGERPGKGVHTWRYRLPFGAPASLLGGAPFEGWRYTHRPPRQRGFIFRLRT